MALPETRFTSIKNLWVRQMHFVNKGDENEGHVHKFDHLTLLAKGSVEVNVDGKLTTFVAPNVIYIQKGKKHFLKSLEDDCLAYCIHALRNADSEDFEILDPDQIPLGVDLASTGILNII